MIILGIDSMFLPTLLYERATARQTILHVDPFIMIARFGPNVFQITFNQELFIKEAEIVISQSRVGADEPSLQGAWAYPSGRKCISHTHRSVQFVLVDSTDHQ
jgi:hypothetical protein